MIQQRGAQALSKLVASSYAEGQTDYSMEPLVLTNYQHQPIGRMQSGDAVIFCCRRGEREIQLTEAFTEPAFDHFERGELKDLDFVILTLYHEKFKDIPVAFAPTKITGTLAETISTAGLSQFHIAESEKYAHITFFLNGGNGEPFTGETDKKIPSPKGIAYDQVPGLSLSEVTDSIIKATHEQYDFIAINFANGDVIGHTSNSEAKAVCTAIVDEHLGKVIDAAIQQNYAVLITADHGNIETLLTPEGTPHVAHTTNPVECILIDPHTTQPASLKDGKLADVAPTILQLMGLEQPEEMTGNSLITTSIANKKRKVMLLILDGWGIGSEDDNNPIYVTKTPQWDTLLNSYPHCRLDASGEAVGLVAGKTGNSEAGHMNIGAGRVVLQDDVRLDRAMKDGSFYTNNVFLNTIKKAKARGKALHLLALLTEKSSHGSIDYPLAILKMAKDAGLEDVFVHVIFDGRSTKPGSAPELLQKLENEMNQIGLGMIVSGIGRGIALDRDGNYHKTKKAYDLLVLGEGCSEA